MNLNDKLQLLHNWEFGHKGNKYRFMIKGTFVRSEILICELEIFDREHRFWEPECRLQLNLTPYDIREGFRKTLGPNEFYVRAETIEYCPWILEALPFIKDSGVKVGYGPYDAITSIWYYDDDELDMFLCVYHFQSALHIHQIVC